jgi:hypothetical protein
LTANIRHSVHGRFQQLLTTHRNGSLLLPYIT